MTETPVVHEDGHVTPPNFYNPVPDPDLDKHEIDEDTLGAKEVPRHDSYAQENLGEPSPARLVPYTPSGGNPSYPGDKTPGFGDEPDAPERVEEAPDGEACADAETVEASTGDQPAEAEAVEAEEGVLNPAGIPPMPDAPSGAAE